MNCTAIMLLVVLLLLAGCGVTQEAGVVFPHQELIEVSPLPPLEFPASGQGKKLGVLFRVLGDGTVAEVRMLKSGGDEHWDSAVVALMKHWRFSVNSGDSTGEGHWYHYLFDVRIGESIQLTLGELVAPARQVADSLYAILNNGVSFASLANQFASGSAGKRGGFLGSVDIQKYPEHVRNELRKLHVNDFTHPLRLGKDYVIFMRFADDHSSNLSQ
jgi:TonB family protein